MICLIACLFGGNSNTHKPLDEVSPRYSPKELIQINGKNWTFCQYLSNGKFLVYSYENCAGKFITTFGLFYLNATGNFIQLSFEDGIDKIETAHDHEPEICGGYVQVKIKNNMRVDIVLKEMYNIDSGKSTYIGLSLTIDNQPISKFKKIYNYKN
jgi:hypothetical protein